jgi:acid phosphatase family membrane protein YuiD
MKVTDELAEAMKDKPFLTVFKATLGYYAAQLLVTSVIGILLAFIFYSIVN